MVRITALFGSLAVLASGRALLAEAKQVNAASLRAELAATHAELASLKAEVTEDRQMRQMRAVMGDGVVTAHGLLAAATASFTEDRRQLSADIGVVYNDQTIIEDTFVSTTLVNASRMTLAGKDMSHALAAFGVRLKVLDEFLQSADVSRYYLYYFGVTFIDGGRARDDVSSYLEMFDPFGIAVATINNKNYAFVCAGGDDTINVLDASATGVDGTMLSEIPLVRQYNALYDPLLGTNLDNPYAIDYHMIGTKHYIFVTTINTDGIMIIDVSLPTAPKFVSYTDDTNVNFDKISNAYGIKAWTIGGKVWLAVSSYTPQATIDGGNGVQIIDVSIPATPKFAASIVDGTDGFKCLNNPWGIDIMEVNGAPFLFVAARTSDCMQVIDLSDPKDPVAAYAYRDMQDTFSYLDDPMYVKGFEVNNRFYVGVYARIDRTIVFVDVTNPYRCTQASSASFTSSMSYGVGGIGGKQFLGLGSGTSHDPQMDVYKTTDVFGRVNTFMVALGYYSYGSFQLIDLSDPAIPIPVAWTQGQTNPGLPYYMMYYYPRGVRVVENKGIHYALVVSEYGSESTSYPNGVQVIKLDPKKTWDLTTTWASDSRIVYRNI